MSHCASSSISIVKQYKKYSQPIHPCNAHCLACTMVHQCKIQRVGDTSTDCQYWWSLPRAISMGAPQHKLNKRASNLADKLQGNTYFSVTTNSASDCFWKALLELDLAPVSVGAAFETLSISIDLRAPLRSVKVNSCPLLFSLA